MALIRFANTLVLRLDGPSIYTFNLFAAIVTLRCTLHHHLRYILALPDILDVKKSTGILILAVECLLRLINNTLATLFQFNFEFQVITTYRKSFAV